MLIYIATFFNARALERTADSVSHLSYSFRGKSTGVEFRLPMLLIFSDLLAQVSLVAKFFDLVKLCLQPIDMALFVFQ